MKPVIKFVAFSLFTGIIVFASCKKEKPVSSVVIPLPPPPPLPPQNINLKLIPFGTLSQARYNILAATAGNKILFAGGNYFVPNCYYDFY